MYILIYTLLSILLFCNIASACDVTAESSSATHVNTAIGSASAGQTVCIPSGASAWGTGTATVTIDKAITLLGSGVESTTVTLGTGPAVSITSDSAVISNFAITADNSSSGTMVNIGDGLEQWVIKGMKLDGGADSTWDNYFIYGSVPSNTTNTYGVVSNNEIINFTGEQIFFRGPCNSWQTDSSLGGAENLFIEGNTFSAKTGESGYMDANANTRTVVRYNAFDKVYFDAHGHKSNTALCTPEYHEGTRHWEIYANTSVDWPLQNFVYLRGGTGVVWGNKQLGTSVGSYIRFDDYSVKQENSQSWQLYYPGCACYSDQPVAYQIGRGKNSSTPVSTGDNQTSEPAYLWNNKNSDGDDITIRIGYGSPQIAAFCTEFCEDPEYTMSDFIVVDRDYYVSETKPDAMSAYTPYTCPHPLTGLTGSCNSAIAGTAGYNVTIGQVTGSFGGNLR